MLADVSNQVLHHDLKVIADVLLLMFVGIFLMFIAILINIMGRK
jgi:hypothetical protein